MRARRALAIAAIAVQGIFIAGTAIGARSRAKALKALIRAAVALNTRSQTAKGG